MQQQLVHRRSNSCPHPYQPTAVGPRRTRHKAPMAIKGYRCHSHLRLLPHTPAAPQAAQIDEEQRVPNLDVEALYTRQVYTPPHPVIHPNLKVQLISGQGAGLVATANCSTGDLLLAVPALAIVYGTVGHVPDNETLASAIISDQADLQPHQLRWLQLLGMARTAIASDMQVTSALSHASGSAQHSQKPISTAAAGSSSREAQEQAPLSWEQQCHELQALLYDKWQPQHTFCSSLPSALEPLTGVTSSPGTGKSNFSGHEQVQGQTQHPSSSSLSPPPNTTAQPDLSSASVVGIMPQRQMSREWVMEAIACNVTGEACEDVALAELRQQEPLQSYLGMFPHYALINHSCAPNTAHVVVGGYILVHAARPITAGEQLTTCYLAQQRYSHVAVRRAVLRQQFGFHCCCERCMLEQQLFPTTRYPADSKLLGSSSTVTWRRLGWSGRVMQWTLGRVFGQGRYLLGAAADPGLLARTNKLVWEQLAPSLQDALAAAPASAAQQRKRLLANLLLVVQQLETTLQALGLEQREMLLLQASCFELYQLITDFARLMPEVMDEAQQVKALQQACRVCDAVTRGADSQLFLATASLARLQQLCGRDSPEARFEQLSCTTAHYARYGRVPKVLLQELLQVRRKTAMAAVLGQRLGVLAWDTVGNKQ